MQTESIEDKLEDADKVIELGEYLRELRNPEEDKCPENASWLGKLWYILNKKSSKSPYCNKEVKVRGTLVDFKLGKELLARETLYVYVSNNNEVVEFRKPFSSSNVKNPSWNYYTTALHDLKEQEITFVAHSYPKGGIFSGFYHFIEGVFKEGELIKF